MFAIFHPLRSDSSLVQRLTAARMPSVDLFTAVAECSGRYRSFAESGKLARLTRLVDGAAWTDAALELLAIAAPRWRVKRIVPLDGEWLCTLSMFPVLPDELDDGVEATHVSLPIALLLCLPLASGRDTAPASARGPSGPTEAAVVNFSDHD
jgi:hypothetical protein